MLYRETVFCFITNTQTNEQTVLTEGLNCSQIHKSSINIDNIKLHETYCFGGQI